VAGLGIRLYTDEMVTPDLADRLQWLGYDVISCHRVGRGNRKISDEDQLAYAAQDGRAFLTFNVDEFYALDASWKAAGRQHAGIILSPEIRDLGTLIRRVREHLDHCSPQQQQNTLLWLGSVTGTTNP
jgi:hypothetical protein